VVNTGFVPGGLLACRWVARGLAAAIVIGVAAAAAPLQAAPLSPAQQGEQLQRQQQDQIDQDQTRILTSPRGQTVIDVPTHSQAVAPAGSCQTITSILVKDAPHMSDGQRDKLIRPYVGRCMGLGDVENLLSDITRFYVEQSEPTTRVYIQTQDLAKGQLVLKVVEGKVEKVELDNKGKHGVNMTTAFGDTDNIAFNLRVFEQGLDQINRLASNNATIDILPGDQPGESIIRIRNTAAVPFHLSVSYDNTGQPSTGQNQGAVTVIGDDLLHLNDQLSYTRRQSILDPEPNANSTSNSVLLSVPYNDLTMTLGFNDSDYVSQAVSNGTTIRLTGMTRNVFAEVDEMAWRDNRSKLDFSATLTNKLDRNYLDGEFLAVSSRDLTVLDMMANYSTIIGDGSVKLGAGWSKGLWLFGSLRDPSGLDSDQQHAQFDKLVGSVYLSLPFEGLGRQWLFTSDIEAQYAIQAVYSSEQIVVGSPFTVRGFLADSLVNDRGFYAQNEVSTIERINLLDEAVLLRPHLGLDAGYASGAAPNTPNGFLTGVAAGLAVIVGPGTVDATVTKSITHAGLPDEGLLAFVRASVSI
jgi:hemolysin activation/secretion protein